MKVIQKVTNKLDRDFSRFFKHTKQRLNPSKIPARALFICGAQRSGTNMLISVLDKLHQTRVYNEDHPLAFRKYRLKNTSSIEDLVKKAPCQWVVFKSIMDSQNTKILLDEIPASKCIWIYRNFKDVAESAGRKWTDAQRHIIRNIATQGNDWDRWYTEGLSVKRRELIRTFYHDSITETTAGALKWYLRNMFYFDLNLNSCPEQVLLVNYNDLVTNPKEQFSRMGKFLEIKFPEHSYQHVHGDSLQKPLPVPIEKSVVLLCDQLMTDFRGILAKSK